MKQEIEQFVADLAAADTAPDAHNEYKGSEWAEIRRGNLTRYLLDMSERAPDMLMVMEAPGYRGCRLTGVPVTSRRVLVEGVPELDMFGMERGYQDIPEPGFESIQGEQSATIVWRALSDLQRTPLIWNSFPFHPHKAGEALTNRRPRRPELEQGSHFLKRMISMYQPTQIIAVGAVAEEVLQGLGHNCTRIRHPAQGGKNDFVAGLKNLLRD